MNFQNLASLRQYLTLSEHKAGTLKVKIKASALGDPIVKECLAEFKNTPMPKAILDTNVNIFTQTITIKYDINSINPEDIDELFNTPNEERFILLAENYYNKLLA